MDSCWFGLISADKPFVILHTYTYPTINPTKIEISIPLMKFQSSDKKIIKRKP